VRPYRTIPHTARIAHRPMASGFSDRLRCHAIMTAEEGDKWDDQGAAGRIERTGLQQRGVPPRSRQMHSRGRNPPRQHDTPAGEVHHSFRIVLRRYRKDDACPGYRAPLRAPDRETPPGQSPGDAHRIHLRRIGLRLDCKLHQAFIGRLHLDCNARRLHVHRLGRRAGFDCQSPPLRT